MTRRRRRHGRAPMGIGDDLERLVIHRELAALRNPTPERFRKLAEARRRAERARR